METWRTLTDGCDFVLYQPLLFSWGGGRVLRLVQHTSRRCFGEVCNITRLSKHLACCNKLLFRVFTWGFYRMLFKALAAMTDVRYENTGALLLR